MRGRHAPGTTLEPGTAMKELKRVANTRRSSTRPLPRRRRWTLATGSLERAIASLVTMPDGRLKMPSASRSARRNAARNRNATILPSWKERLAPGTQAMPRTAVTDKLVMIELMNTSPMPRPKKRRLCIILRSLGPATVPSAIMPAGFQQRAHYRDAKQNVKPNPDAVSSLSTRGRPVPGMILEPVTAASE
ncbi:unnamed protein product [Symbiodinium necroappetens]|uniref:Uncharacterized protein n=1 Tax=Symbiodinium necroappetens TaxID=1628268 RepID=A0A812LLD9_9DINO|nr:unnamed protein product [Symbiodinium necroappetens]